MFLKLLNIHIFTETYSAGYFFLIEVACHVVLQQHGSTADTYMAGKFPIYNLLVTNLVNAQTLAYAIIVIYLFFPDLILICNNLPTIQSLLASEYVHFERIHSISYFITWLLKKDLIV